MLRECHWEGLPPPPVFPTQKPKPTGANKNESAATPVAAPLGLPYSGLELQTTQPPPPEPTPTPEVDTVPDSPIIQSPSISIATLSDFPSQVHLMTTLMSTSLPQLRMRPSTSRMGTSKCCAGMHSSVSTPASYPSILLCSIGRLLRLAWLQRNHPMAVPAFCPLTRQRISPYSSR